jgi:phage host-nuclease inhibitor protein Gam
MSKLKFFISTTGIKNYVQNYGVEIDSPYYNIVERIENIIIRYDKLDETSKTSLFNKLNGKMDSIQSGMSNINDKTKLNEAKSLVTEMDDLVTEMEKQVGGRRRNQPKHTDMTMKDIKGLCKANQIKLSRVIDDKRVVYKKTELLTKLKRKKII